DPLLSASKQANSQSCLLFAGELRERATKLLRGFETHRLDKDLLTRFIYGLADEKVRDNLVRQSDHLSFIEAVELASRLEQCYARFPKPTAGVNKAWQIDSHSKGTNVQHTSNNNNSNRPATCKAILCRKIGKRRYKQVIRACHYAGCAGNSEPILGMCCIQGRPIEYELDTGADLTIISERIYRELQPIPALVPCETDFVAANGVAMQVIGQIRVPIRLGNEESSETLYVVSDLANDMLLGRELMSKFGSINDTMAVVRHRVRELSRQVMSSTIESPVGEWKISAGDSVDETSARKWAEKRFQSLTAQSMDDLRPMVMRSKLFTHSITLKNESKGPVRERARRIPESKRKEFRELLDEMLNRVLYVRAVARG
ncbi:retroviral-like aspartic protease family protein, partial [Candidatus Saccharibacteria bacterium]|nr:retroviral-like aspartic protease family protein [Candidatus Saccharibacteria bacterium]